MDVGPEGPDTRTLSQRCDAVAEGRGGGEEGVRKEGGRVGLGRQSLFYWVQLNSDMNGQHWNASEGPCMSVCRCVC